MATTVNFTMFTADKRILELTVKDVDAAVVDLSGASTTDIHWIMQAGIADPTNQVYYDLSSGIAFKTDGTDGIVQVTIAEAATSALDASAGDLVYSHQLSVKVTARPAITMEGAVTIKERLLKVTNIELDGPTFDVTTEYPAGTLTIS